MPPPPLTPRRRVVPALVALGAVAVLVAAVLLVLHPHDPGATALPSSDAEASATKAPATSLAAGRRTAASPSAPESASPPTPLSGTVWRDGRPALVRVEIRESAAPRADAEAALATPLPAPTPLATAATDADGRFSATIDGTGRFEALARAADGATAFARFRVDRPGEPAVVVLHLAPAGETLRGRIRFPDGTPFVGLVATRLDARRTRWLEAPPVATDADGRFAVPGVSAGRTTVLAWRPGEITVSRRGILLPHDGEIEIVVGGPIATLRGVVVDSRTGNPIAFAAVNLNADDRADDLFRTRTVAGTDGRFTILASGRHPSLTVVADGYARLTLPAVDPALSCEVSLAAHASVSGRVLRETDAAPIPAAHVEALSLASRTLGEIIASATSDALGRYRIDGLPPGDFAIVGSTAEWTSPRPSNPKSGDWGPLLVTLAPGAMADRDLRLQRVAAPALPDGPPAAAPADTDGGVTLEVTVLDDPTGAPIGGARVWAPGPWSRAATTTDASGRATLTGVDRHFYNGQLGVDVPGHGAARRRLESIEGSEVTVRLGPMRTLSGRVERKDGTPVPGAEVSLFDEGTADTTAADGTFGIEGAPGDATNVCVVIADEEGCSVGMAFGQGVPGTELVIVFDEAEDAIDGPPRLDPAPAGQGIVARVTDAEGRPVPSARAALVRWDYAWPAEVRSGRVAWDGVPGAEARLQVWGARDGYGVPLPLGCASVPLLSEARTVEVRLPPLSAVTGVVLGPEGTSAPGVLVIATWPRDAAWIHDDPGSTEAIGSARTDAMGRFSISGPAERQEVALVVVAPTGTLAPRARARGGGGAVEVRLTRADADSKGPRVPARETTVLPPSPSGLTIRGRLTLPPEATHVLVTARRDGLLARGVVSEDGRFEIVGLPPGDWSLRAACEARGEWCDAEATVAAGDTADLFLQAPRRMYE